MPYDMIPVASAQSIVLAQCQTPTQTTSVPIACCTNRIAHADVYSRLPIPQHHTSIKDGFAVSAAAFAPNKPFTVVKHVFAERQDDQTEPVANDQAVYIATGGVLPPGTDAVVQVEDATETDSTVTFHCDSVRSQQDVRLPGSDIRQGEVVVKQGHVLRPQDVGLLAMTGHRSVDVHAPVSVAVASTGDELVDIVDTAELRSLPKGRVYDANRPMLLACLAECANVKSQDYGIVEDSTDGFAALVTKALEDRKSVLVTSGGVSMGKKDFVKDHLSKVGKVHFGKLNMKPGKPTTFATVARETGAPPLLVFSLPGNPVSAFATFQLLVLPALLKLSGCVPPFTAPEIRCETVEPIQLDSGRPEYHRATVLAPKANAQGALQVKSTGFQRSSRLASLSGANVLLQLPKGDVLPKGTIVDGLVFDDLRITHPKMPSANSNCSVGVVVCGSDRLKVVAENAVAKVLGLSVLQNSPDPVPVLQVSAEPDLQTVRDAVSGSLGNCAIGIVVHSCLFGGSALASVERLCKGGGLESFGSAMRAAATQSGDMKHALLGTDFVGRPQSSPAPQFLLAVHVDEKFDDSLARRLEAVWPALLHSIAR